MESWSHAIVRLSRKSGESFNNSAGASYSGAAEKPYHRITLCHGRRSTPRQSGFLVKRVSLIISGTLLLATAVMSYLFAAGRVRIDWNDELPIEEAVV